MSPLEIVAQVQPKLAKIGLAEIGQIVARVMKLAYCGEWEQCDPLLGVTETEVAEAAAAATAAQRKRGTWYDADNLAGLAGVGEILDRRADRRTWDRFGLCLETGGVVGVRRRAGRIHAYVVGAGEPVPEPFPVVDEIKNLDDPEQPLNVHDVGPSADPGALAEFIKAVAA